MLDKNSPTQEELEELTLRQNMKVVKRQMRDLEQSSYTPKEWLELKNEMKEINELLDAIKSV